MIPFNRASFNGNELAYLQEAIEGGHVSGNGPFTLRAESLLEERLRGGRVLLTTSCTHALEMCALLLRLQPGDEVVVPAFTFVSTASAFLLHGGKPIFADVDPVTFNLDPGSVEDAISERTRAVVVVHYGGVAARLDRLTELCRRRGLMLIEDNAHGLLGDHKGRPLATFGALATQSFHETKNVSCGEGGALVVNDEALVERAEILREKGTDRSKFLRGQVDKYTWVDAGSSYVLSDLLAAVLLGQLERIEEIQVARHALHARYAEQLASWAAEHRVGMAQSGSAEGHTAHLFHLLMPDEMSRDELIAHLREREILAVFHYQPLHLSKVGISLGGRPGQCPVAESVAACLLRLPLFEALGPEEQQRVIDAVRSFKPRRGDV